jgi:hypothetical protein
MVEGCDYLFAGNKYLTTEGAIKRFKERGQVYFRRGTRIFCDDADILVNITDFVEDTDKFLAVEILKRIESR